MPDTGHSLEEGDFPGIGSGALFGRLFFMVKVSTSGFFPTVTS